MAEQQIQAVSFRLDLALSLVAPHRIKLATVARSTLERTEIRSSVCTSSLSTLWNAKILLCVTSIPFSFFWPVPVAFQGSNREWWW